MSVNYDIFAKKEVSTPERLKLFLDDIEEVCKKHKLSISFTNEDKFLVTDIDSDLSIGMLRECEFGISSNA